MAKKESLHKVGSGMGQDLQIYYLTAFLATFLLVGIGTWLFTFMKKKKSNFTKNNTKVRPEKWCLVGKVAKLIVYPIKSCQGIVVEEAVVTRLGLKLRDHNIRDRDFMVVDKKGKSITLDLKPAMSFITLEPSLEKKNHLVMSAPGMDSITFTYPDAVKSEERICRVMHDKNVKALDCGDQVAEWIQTFLGKEELRLFYHHVPETQRTFEPYMNECPLYEKTDMGAFQNETSYLIVGQESIDELNARLPEKKSSWRNWRPTILIDNVLEPFAEINWSFVKIGGENVILKAAIPCARCGLTTVDQDTGTVPKDGEPLKTLRQMNKTDVIVDRKMAEVVKNKGIMGIRMGLYVPARAEGSLIKVGDPIYAALL